MPLKGSTNPHIRKYKVNSNFFKKWNPQMAYILGFAFADGNVYHTTFSWKLANNKSNRELLMKINRVMDSNYPIEKQTNGFRLRISHVLLVKDLINLRVIPNKSKKSNFPKIPPLFFRHFIRGFLDGDGWITANKKKTEISVGFSNGSYAFLKGLANYLNKKLPLSDFNLRKRVRLTKNQKISTTYMMEYYSENAYKIICYLYNNLGRGDIFLSRKYKNQLKARKIYEDLTRGGHLWRKIEDKYKKPMREILFSLYKERGLDGFQIAKTLKVHSSSIYRWLEKTKIRIPVKRTRHTIVSECPICKKEIEYPRGRFKKYCSPQCRLKGKQTGKIVECIVCQKQIYRPKWWFKVNTIPFCSRICVGKWQSTRLKKNLLRRSKTTGQFLLSLPFERCQNLLIRK